MAGSRRMASIERLLQRHEALVEEIAMGRGVLFAGAGLSMGAGLPGWQGLLDALRAALDLPPPPRRTTLLDEASWLQRAAGGRAALAEPLRAILGGSVVPTPVQRALVRLPLRAIFTTNFDHLIEAALDAERIRYEVVRFDE